MVTSSPAVPGSQRAREQRAWYFYDWANSAYVTTAGAVLFAPYLTSVAERSSCGYAGTTSHPCRVDLQIAGIGISAGSLVFYAVTVTTILSAFVLPVVGALADRSATKRRLMCRFAWLGAAAASAMVLVTGTDWQLGVALLLIANLALGGSLVCYDAILCEIAVPAERDRVSSRGWALGYLGGGSLLAANLVLVTLHRTWGMSTATSVRISLLSAGLWWAGFTLIPYLGIRDRPPTSVVPESGSLLRRSFGQLATTLRETRAYPMTLLFLAAYLFFNDGIQTVIGAASVFGEKQLGFSTSFLIAVILLVQFVAFGGALLFGVLAARLGSKRTIMAGLVVWMMVVSAAYALPAHRAWPFIALAIAIGVVLGGCQALSRSFYSLLIPRGREAEYFSLYQACERGTSWLGTLVFGLMHQWTGSYRPAIFALVAFFALGLALLAPVDTKRAIREAGNDVPPSLM